MVTTSVSRFVVEYDDDYDDDGDQNGDGVDDMAMMRKKRMRIVMVMVWGTGEK